MIGPIRRKLLVTALRERRFWVVLGSKASAWRAFVRSLAAEPDHDLAVLRLKRQPALGRPYYVWVTYRLEAGRRGRPRLVPRQLFMPADEEGDSRLGMPTELRGRPFFAPDASAGSDSPDRTGGSATEVGEPLRVGGPG